MHKCNKNLALSAAHDVARVIKAEKKEAVSKMGSPNVSGKPHLRIKINGMTTDVFFPTKNWETKKRNFIERMKSQRARVEIISEN